MNVSGRKKNERVRERASERERERERKCKSYSSFVMQLTSRRERESEVIESRPRPHDGCNVYCSLVAGVSGVENNYGFLNMIETRSSNLIEGSSIT